MTIERNFDVSLIANLALREKQIQQNYRPIISVHKWFARRPGTLFRGLLLSEFGKLSLEESFFRANKLTGIRIADPFMGGGIPLIEANRLGCDVVGYDINPMAYWIVREEIEHLNLIAYRGAAENLTRRLEHEVGTLYRTRCVECGFEEAHAKYFLWVKVQACRYCHTDFDLFPGYVLAEDRRHPKNVVVCHACGDLTEVDDLRYPGDCRSCDTPLAVSGPAKRNRCKCSHCGAMNQYPNPASGPPKHRMFAIEYHCPQCRSHHRGRYFKVPDERDLGKFAEASSRFQDLDPKFIPDEEIPSGDETDRLHRWGYSRYREMFNDRQLVSLEMSCRIITEQTDARIRNALATNLSDLLRYQNMLCRYDTMALKSLDIFSIHGFPVGLVECESNLIGISKASGGNIGSGGWTNIIEKYTKAKAYCDQPFEIRYEGKKKIKIPIVGEWIGEKGNGILSDELRQVELHCRNAMRVNLPPGSLDAVFTDPPYFGNVQYAELMDFCYVWLRQLVAPEGTLFEEASTRSPNELTRNATLDRGLHHFVQGLSAVFKRMAAALKPGAPLAFTYHHNRIDAYYPVAVAILDSGLTCSASLPCPAEMGGSIHISGTKSSIVDTIFVCRSTGSVPRRWIAGTTGTLADLVRDDLEKLRVGGLHPTRGDIRCVIYGHLTRLATWRLRQAWNTDCPFSRKLQLVSEEITDLGGLEDVEGCLSSDLEGLPTLRGRSLQEEGEVFGESDEISF